MTGTLEGALAPLLIIGSFCNLCIFEYPRGQPRPYLSCLYVLVKWGYITYYYYPQIIEDWQTSKMISFSDFLPLIIITSIFFGFYHFKELKMCLRKLAIVDDTLEALGAPKEYRRLRNWIIRIIIGWIVYVFFQLAFFQLIVFIYAFTFNYVTEWTMMLDKFLRSLPKFIIILSALISAAILGCISSRFHRINERLRVLYSDLFESSVDYRRQNRSIFVHQRITEAKDHNQYIWIIM